uniref:Uncharacterized protein n=1 Tax=Cynoglossus semilaevis TaxID=244447 RepID=A0A3P8W936_CYNSE
RRIESTRRFGLDFIKDDDDDDDDDDDITSGSPLSSSCCPPQVLVELKELVVNRNQELQWQETARWTKFEGAVEAESRPYLSPLSFHSLLELRRTITQGDVLLDLKERTLQGISEQVVRQLVRSQQIQDQDRDLVQNLILLRHSCLRDEKDDGWSSSQSEPSKAQSNHREPEEKKLSERGPERAEATLVLVGTLDGLDRPCVAFVRLQESVLLEAVLDVPVPVRFLFLLLGPPTSSLNYHLIGRSISTLMSDTRFHQAMYQVDNQQDLLATIDRLLECSEGLLIFLNVLVFIPIGSPGPSKPREDHLKRSGRLFGGLVRDVTRRYPQYLSDITDALNPQCMAAVIFIYFAALSPAITFGGLLAEKTEGLMGVSELMVATAVQGTVFSLVGAQPLLVIGFSGPLLVFEEAFYSFCRVNGVDYLTGRVWIGFWLVLIVLLTVAFEGSVLVALVSRFTQEIFSFLITQH